MYEVNVVGTENVINACIQQGVLKLVYTSSSSVVFEGRDLIDVDESIPLARKPVDFYAMTKVSKVASQIRSLNCRQMLKRIQLHCFTSISSHLIRHMNGRVSRHSAQFCITGDTFF